MFGLYARFTCKDLAAAKAYDALVAETVERIRDSEPGTVIYAVHEVEGEPLMRAHYELFADRAAFEAHEAAPHTRHYLAQRGKFLAAEDVDWLRLEHGKVPGS